MKSSPHTPCSSPCSPCLRVAAPSIQHSEFNIHHSPVFVVLRNFVSSWLSRLLLSLFLVLLASCGGDGQRASSLPKLKILSPHGSAIRLEFERSFARWHQQKYGTAVEVEWRSAGGTKEIQKFLDTVYAHGTSADIDLIFGGGSAVFDGLSKTGYLESPNPPLTPDMLAGMAPEASGSKLFGANNLWIAATMSNFGFVVNKTRLAELHLPRPTTWQDLTGPGWIGNLAVADPSKSGSVSTCYEMILQQYGWQAGWPILVKIFANAESIQISGPAPGDEAGSGNAVAGIVIDFYGRTAIIKQGSDLMEFIVPVGGSTLDPDPIAVLKGAPNPTLASHFLEFIASTAGQRLWIQRPGTPGGPERKALGRMSTNPKLYETAAPYLTDPSNPFAASSPTAPPNQNRARKEAVGLPQSSQNQANQEAAELVPSTQNPTSHEALFPPDTRNSDHGPASQPTSRRANVLKLDIKIMRQRTSFIGEVIKSALVDNHTELQAARHAVHDAGDPPELLALFDQLPFAEPQTAEIATAWKEKSNQPALRNQWRKQFHDLFITIKDKAGH